MVVPFLKRWLPHSLYGRAALILLVPVMTILLVVTVVFIQRLYDGVTRQLTTGVANEIVLILDQTRDAPDAAQAMAAAIEIASPLGIEIKPADMPLTDRIERFDLSGLAVIETLNSIVPETHSVDLESRPGFARVVVDTGDGLIALDVPRDRVTARNPHQFLVLIGITAILMSVIALIYLRNQMRPIRRLAFAAEAFGKGRVIPYRPTGATEVRSAGAAFLDMRDRIEKQIEQRTLMLSGVSHDLRTPLTRMKLGLTLMEDGDEVAMMRKDVEDMERMLEAFLSFARGEAIEDPVRTDPAELVREVAERHSNSGLPVRLGDLRGEGTAMLRPDALRRALDNLVINAVRYGGEARIGAELTISVIRFIVEDPGPGIPTDQHEYVLGPFTRLDVARNQDGGPGVGLGLAIAADVARKHGGKLSLGVSADLGGLYAEIAIPR